jgi:hypothetical protein
MNLAQLRSPAVDDGTIARILWKQSEVLEEDILRATEAKALRHRAAVARRDISKRENLVDGQEGDFDAQEQSYDELVPGYYR